MVQCQQTHKKAKQFAYLPVEGMRVVASAGEYHLINVPVGIT
jgi:hypothetical protein